MGDVRKCPSCGFVSQSRSCPKCGGRRRRPRARVLFLGLTLALLASLFAAAPARADSSFGNCTSNATWDSCTYVSWTTINGVDDAVLVTGFTSRLVYKPGNCPPPTPGNRRSEFFINATLISSTFDPNGAECSGGNWVYWNHGNNSQYIPQIYGDGVAFKAQWSNSINGAVVTWS